MSWQSTHTTALGNVHIIGEQERIIDNPQTSFDKAILYGANNGRIAQLIVAGDHTMDGHKRVYPARFDSPKFWDGAVISEANSAVIIQTADCPSLILTNKKTGRAALAHAGRPALTGPCNVVGNAVHAVLGGYDDAEDIEALVVGSICGSCFKHDYEEAKPLIEYFLKLPPYVFTDRETGALDLFQVVRHDLIHHGVSDKNIRYEGPCTFETPGLSSYRRDKTSLRNTIIMVLS
jgi:copper oxidase (laccase) domain-containing protein